ncbi:MAG: hypothetical protein LUQ37_00935 [Methanoregulaceae archaeon]|jgi:hypothetical protein|nr:hypothetical protein [Methanoregulaceae archaeon]
MNPDNGSFLELVYEARIGDLLKGSEKKHFEASGIYLKGGYLHIIFDDEPSLLRIRPNWLQIDEEPYLFPLKSTGAGYEDITFQSSTGRWLCLIEAVKTKSDVYMPLIDEFDESFSFIRSYWLNFPLKEGNKGFEGLAIIHNKGTDYLLCLCEGNDCKSGEKGAKPGKGRIQVFKQVGEHWEHTGSIRLPGAVRFKDYVSLDFSNGLLTVISQASSALWIGHCRSLHQGLDNLFDDDGQSFLFPRDEKNRTMYCNMEGVAWLGNGQLVVVSDKVKPDQPGRCSRKDQSIHIFKLPDEDLPLN